MPNKIKVNSRYSFFLLLLVATLFSNFSCSGKYILRAGFEQAKVLLNREKVSDLLEDPKLSGEVKKKLALVLRAREFSKTINLDPQGSYKKYIDVKRKELLWVLTASEKLKLEPVTWWFPFVGSVPYKGFFEKKDAITERDSLIAKGYDVYLRVSQAFSTLGWFDDPLFSTVLNFEDIDLIDTVFHEILHQNIWFKNHVSFNETLANFVGHRAAKEFFTSEKNLEKAELLDKNWKLQLKLSELFEKNYLLLEKLYSPADLSKEEVIKSKTEIFLKLYSEWEILVGEFYPQNKSNSSRKKMLELNNATLLAHRTYLTKPWLFEEVYQRCDSSIARFLVFIRKFKLKTEDSSEDPYKLLSKSLLSDISC